MIDTRELEHTGTVVAVTPSTVLRRVLRLRAADGSESEVDAQHRHTTVRHAQRRLANHGGLAAYLTVERGWQRVRVVSEPDGEPTSGAPPPTRTLPDWPNPQ